MQRGGEKVPFYTFKCTECEDERDYITKYGVEEVECKACGEAATKQPSFRVNVTGLPNGFSATRSKSRTHKETKI